MHSTSHDLNTTVHVASSVHSLSARANGVFSSSNFEYKMHIACTSVMPLM